MLMIELLLLSILIALCVGIHTYGSNNPSNKKEWGYIPPKTDEELRKEASRNYGDLLLHQKEKRNEYNRENNGFWNTRHKHSNEFNQGYQTLLNRQLHERTNHEYATKYSYGNK